MAVAIPLIAMGMGASAWTVAAITIAASATGVSRKVNEAAAGVFGEDLVNAANLAGSVWMAYSAFNPDSAYSVGKVFGGSSGAAATTAEAASSTAAEGASAATPAGATAGGTSGGALQAGAGTESVVASGSAGAGGTPVLPQAAAQSTAAGASEAATSAGAKTFAQAGSQEVGKEVVKKGFFDGMTDWQKYGLMQAGGQMLSGTMQGAAQAESMEQQRAWQLEDAARYRSGSGMTNYYARRPVFAAAGAPAISPPGTPPGMIPGMPAGAGGFIPPQQYGPQPIQVGPAPAYYGVPPAYGRR